MAEHPVKHGGKKHRFLFTVSALICLCAVLFGIEYRIAHRKLGEVQSTYKTAVVLAADMLDFTMREIGRLSHILMINADVRKFVTQDRVEQGSSDIQTVIDAQRQLSYLKSVHPDIAALFVYSKKSDYLLEADNAFFDIDAMYTSLFEFTDLNSAQWRSQYLRPVYTNRWLKETSLRSNGVSRSIVPFAQTFPLQNPGANAGKLIILLKAASFESLTEPLFSLPDVFVRISDVSNRCIFVRSGSAKNGTAAEIPENLLKIYTDLFKNIQEAADPELTLFTHKAEGKTYTIFVQPLKSSGMFLTAAVPRSALLRSVPVFTFLYAPFVCVLLMIGGFALVTLLPFLLRAYPACIRYAAVQPFCVHFAKENNKAPDVLLEKDALMIKRITDYIENNYPDPLLNLSHIARAFGIKESFLYHFFRSRIHKSFSCYLEDFRLEKARSLIEKDIGEPIHSLAQRCGYANAQTFRRAFKKKYALTPSEFKHRVFADTGKL